jgi:hypothetical protein
MSGGYFNYDQYKITEIADAIEELIINNGSEKKDEWGRRLADNFAPETIAEFRKGLDALREAYIYAQRIDWLVSGDDGENQFHKRLKNDLLNR